MIWSEAAGLQSGGNNSGACCKWLNLHEVVGLKTVKDQDDKPTTIVALFFSCFSRTRGVTQFTEHYHTERNHQGKGNVLLFPEVEEFRQTCGPSIRCRERLGGLLKYYYPRVA